MPSAAMLGVLVLLTQLSESASNGQVSAVEILGPVFGTRSSNNTARSDRVRLPLPSAHMPGCHAQ